jgi:hypothetical protein
VLADCARELATPVRDEDESLRAPLADAEPVVGRVGVRNVKPTSDRANAQKSLTRPASRRRLAGTIPVERDGKRGRSLLAGVGRVRRRRHIAGDRGPVGSEGLVGVGGVEGAVERGEIADTLKGERGPADTLEMALGGESAGARFLRVVVPVRVELDHGGSSVDRGERGRLEWEVTIAAASFERVGRRDDRR